MSSEYSLLYTKEAQEDIRDIYAYIAFELEVKQTAREQVNRIRDAIRSLANMPRRHSVVGWEPWVSMGMRHMTIGNYVVFYLVDETNRTITVVRVLYGGRDVEHAIQKLQ